MILEVWKYGFATWNFISCREWVDKCFQTEYFHHIKYVIDPRRGIHTKWKTKHGFVWKTVNMLAIELNFIKE